MNAHSSNPTTNPTPAAWSAPMGGHGPMGGGPMAMMQKRRKAP